MSVTELTNLALMLANEHRTIALSVNTTRPYTCHGRHNEY